MSVSCRAAAKLLHQPRFLLVSISFGYCTRNKRNLHMKVKLCAQHISLAVFSFIGCVLLLIMPQCVCLCLKRYQTVCMLVCVRLCTSRHNVCNITRTNIWRHEASGKRRSELPSSSSSKWEATEKGVNMGMKGEGPRTKAAHWHLLILYSSVVYIHREKASQQASKQPTKVEMNARYYNCGQNMSTKRKWATFKKV